MDTIQTLIVSVEQAAQALATTKQTVYTLHSTDPNFPRIFKVGKRRSGLLFSELERWVKHRHDHHQIRGVVVQNLHTSTK